MNRMRRQWTNRMWQQYQQMEQIQHENSSNWTNRRWKKQVSKMDEQNASTIASNGRTVHKTLSATSVACVQVWTHWGFWNWFFFLPNPIFFVICLNFQQTKSAQKSISSTL
jgi:type IV secretory pathway component VirB8